MYIHIYIYICIYVYMYANTHNHTYTYTNKNTQIQPVADRNPLPSSGARWQLSRVHSVMSEMNFWAIKSPQSTLPGFQGRSNPHMGAPCIGGRYLPARDCHISLTYIYTYIYIHIYKQTFTYTQSRTLNPYRVREPAGSFHECVASGMSCIRALSSRHTQDALASKTRQPRHESPFHGRKAFGRTRLPYIHLNIYVYTHTYVHLYINTSTHTHTVADCNPLPTSGAHFHECTEIGEGLHSLATKWPHSRLPGFQGCGIPVMGVYSMGERHSEHSEWRPNQEHLMVSGFWFVMPPHT